MRGIVIAFIGLMVLLSACVQQPQAPSVPSQPITVPQAQENKTVAPAVVPSEPCTTGSILQKDECFLNLAKSKGSVSYCDSIYSADKRDECIFGFAKSDGKLCDRLFASSYRSDCFLAYARAKGDFQICSKIGNDSARAACLKELSPACSFETDEVAKGRCLAFNKSDYTFCKDTECKIDFAFSSREDGACNLLPENELAARYACFALARNSTSWCARAGEKLAVSDYCYQIFALKAKDVGVCDLGSEGSQYRNSCYLTFALNGSNPTLCKNPAPEEARDDCYLNYSVSKNEVAVCENVINSLNRAKCYIYTAKANGNPAACNKLQFGTLEPCMVQVLSNIGLGSPDYCKDVADSLWKDKCYVVAAEKFRNQTLCAFVSDTDQIAKCNAPFKYT